MKNSIFLKTLLFASIIVFLAAFKYENKAEKPNIIIIFSDDHALQAISAYGSPHINTPNIDRIAREGAIFKNSFCTNSLCAPSRAVLLTGKYNHINGQKDNTPQSDMDTRQPMFSKTLMENGYQTSWIGKWHIKNNPVHFDYWKILPGQGQYYNPDFINMDGSRERISGYSTEITTDMSLDWLERRDKSKPFCMVIGQKAPHREWLPDIQDLHAFDGKTFKLPDNYFDDYEGRKAAKHQLMEVKDQRWALDSKFDGQNTATVKRMSPEQQAAWNKYYDTENAKIDTTKMSAKEKALWKYQRYMHDYLGCVVSLDRNIGRVLDYLDKNNLTENTVVIYTSDQGFYLGEHGWYDKRFMYEQSLRMPLVMRFPKLIKPKTEVNEMVVNIDFAPTILNLVGLSIPSDIQGKSFLPLFSKNKPKDWRKATFYHYYEYPQDHRVMPHFGIRTDRYKLIRFYGKNGDFWELYDLKKDADEMKNIYEKPENQAIIKTLKVQLNDLIKQYQDVEAEEVLKKRI